MGIDLPAPIAREREFAIIVMSIQASHLTILQDNQLSRGSCAKTATRASVF